MGKGRDKNDEKSAKSMCHLHIAFSIILHTPIKKLPGYKQKAWSLTLTFSCASSALASFHERTAEIQNNGERASRRYQQNSHGFLVRNHKNLSTGLSYYLRLVLSLKMHNLKATCKILLKLYIKCIDHFLYQFTRTTITEVLAIHSASEPTWQHIRPTDAAILPLSPRWASL